ncbi:GNAT family N-acetyltransferase [Actinokineospora sp.]|uniref:GNAT family N-acetyltransferase n=1 Tax=Actinokineospora sp. TaxID=1872133 RepID=UPI003D6A0B73
MHELKTPADVAAATTDPVLRWGAQALMPEYPTERGQAWEHDGAVLVYAPGLYRRDRVILTGPAEQALKLITSVRLPTPGAPIARTELADEICQLEPGWSAYATFGWMTTMAEPGPRPDGVRWLDDFHLDDADYLVRTANPDGWLVPRETGTRRWAGMFDGDTLVSMAGDAWPAPDMGFIAGVATHKDYRGKGASNAVCAFVRDTLLAEHGACGLMVYADNATAIRLYERLGFTYQSMTAFGPE